MTKNGAYTFVNSFCFNGKGKILLSQYKTSFIQVRVVKAASKEYTIIANSWAPEVPLRWIPRRKMVNRMMGRAKMTSRWQKRPIQLS